MIEEREIDLRDYLRVLVRQRWVMLGVVATMMLGTLVYVVRLPDVYEAQAVIQNGSVDKADLSTVDVQFFIQSLPVLQPVVAQYNAAHPGRELTIAGFRGMITVDSFIDNRFLLTVQAPDAAGAQQLCTMLAEGYFSYMRGWYDKQLALLEEKIAMSEENIEEVGKSSKELKKEIARFVRERKLTPEPAFKSIMLRSLYSQYINELATYQSNKINLTSVLYGVKEFAVLEPPELPTAPIREDRNRILGIMAGVSILAALLLAFLVDYFQRANLFGKAL